MFPVADIHEWTPVASSVASSGEVEHHPRHGGGVAVNRLEDGAAEVVEAHAREAHTYIGMGETLRQYSSRVESRQRWAQVECHWGGRSARRPGSYLHRYSRHCLPLDKDYYE